MYTRHVGDIYSWWVKWATAWQKPKKRPVHPVKTQISLGIHPGWSESSLCAEWLAKDPKFLRAYSKDWSEWAHAQVDLSFRWAHRSFCWFCHAVAQIKLSSQINFWFYMSHVMRKPTDAICEQQSADQPVHVRSLISAFVVHCLDSIISLFTITKISIT